MGARGNSGVILSQLFRGLGEAVKASRRSVARRWPARSKRAARRPSGGFAAGRGHDPDRRPRRLDGRGHGADCRRHARARACRGRHRGRRIGRAHADIAAGPEERDVVDAGGKGLELLLRGALASVRGETEPHISAARSTSRCLRLDAWRPKVSATRRSSWSCRATAAPRCRRDQTAAEGHGRIRARCR